MKRNLGRGHPQQPLSQRLPLPYARLLAAFLLIETILCLIVYLLLTGHWIATVVVAPLVGLAGIIAKKI